VDRNLKERLVGALVLVVLAVVVIPELLSGPGDDADVANSAAGGGEQAPLKTYTIDFAKQKDAGAGEAASLATAASGPDATQGDIELPAPVPREATPQTAAPGPRPAAASASAGSKPAPAATPVPAPAKPAPTPAPAEPARTTGAWAVQAGSFSTSAAANKVAGDLKRRGYASFVTEFRSGGKTLHRVRVGPVATRAEAEALVRKLKDDGTAATVVSNP
jgi:DedD protein